MYFQDFSATTNEESKPHLGDIQNVNHNPNSSFTTPPKLERTREDADFSNSAIVQVESSNPISTPTPNPNPNIICEVFSCLDCHAKLECPNCHAYEFNNSKGGLPDIAGFCFNPTDEDLIVYYLKKKVMDEPLPHYEIQEVELYKHNPDDITVNYNGLGGKQWYFFTPRDRKYKNGTRPNRAAGSGYWKATGADKPINFEGRQVGHRKSLVFYYGKAPKGDKTNWIMHEYRVDEPPRARTSGDDMRLDDWVLCRIYKKDDKINKSPKQHEESSPHDEPSPGGPPPPSPNNGNKLGEIANPINYNSNNIILPQVPATHVPNYSPGHSFMHAHGVPSSFGNFSTHYETNFSGVQQRLPPVFQNPVGNIYDQNADYPLQNLSNFENIEDFFLNNGNVYDQMENLESISSNNVLEGNFNYQQQQRDSKGL